MVSPATSPYSQQLIESVSIAMRMQFYAIEIARYKNNPHPAQREG